MNDINGLINEVFKGIEITEKERNIFKGIYLSNFYKYLLELLITYKTQNSEFINKQ